MSQDFAKKLYASPAWRKNRAAYLRKPIETPWGVCPPGVCERCFENGEIVPAKVVHHRIHLTPQNINDPHVTLSYDNFQRLCQDCHAFVHSGQTVRVRFDENGQIVEPRQEDSFERLVMQLTEPDAERRNIHKEGR